MVSRVTINRVNILMDNMAIIKSYENQSGKCQALNNIMKEISEFVSSQNIDLRLSFVPTLLNEAGSPSRQLSLADSTLARSS